MKKGIRLSAVLASILLAAAVPAGYGGPDQGTMQGRDGADAYTMLETESTKGDETFSIETDSSGTTQKKTKTRRERLAERKKEAQEQAELKKNGQEATKQLESADSDPSTITAISAVGGLEAAVEQDDSECIVFIFDEELNHGNPYDVTWDYGEEYNAYLDKVDWTLVFDAEYYKSLFPTLALQYHDDDDLLLRHFQTVGIHEGRQGCESFNVAAYMDHCSQELLDAFGDNYECYYLYYMLHQDTEAKLKTTGDYKGQLAMDLTSIQKTELKWVNYYREEVDADPVAFDSELAAFAAYRAYQDCTEGWDAHDGLEELQKNGLLDEFMDELKIGIYCENKDTLGGSKKSAKSTPCYQHSDYRGSEGHYKTMVGKDYHYVGCGNLFVSEEDYNWDGKYEVNRITLDTYASRLKDPYYDE